jgi:uncharacterized membrane protein
MITRHPIHPMLVHFPLACWLLTAASDVAALAMARPFFWHVSALLSLTGLVMGGIAAMFRAMELQRVKGQARLERLAAIHGGIMGGAWVVALVAMVLRIDDLLLTRIPAPMIVHVLDFVVAGLVLAGAFLGGEMVYRYGVGVKRAD